MGSSIGFFSASSGLASSDSSLSSASGASLASLASARGGYSGYASSCRFSVAAGSLDLADSYSCDGGVSSGSSFLASRFLDVDCSSASSGVSGALGSLDVFCRCMGWSYSCVLFGCSDRYSDSGSGLGSDEGEAFASGSDGAYSDAAYSDFHSRDGHAGDGDAGVDPLSRGGEDVGDHWRSLGGVYYAYSLDV